MNPRARWLIACLMPPIVGSAPFTLRAQTVQLPVYHVFQMPLNVVVPDHGTAFAGGVDYASSDQSSRGLPLLGPTATEFASRHGGSRVHVSATIIDHREWDAALLAESDRTNVIARTALQKTADRLSRQIQATTPAVASVEALQARARRTEVARNARESAEALEWIRQGDECLNGGQSGAARIFYRMALRRGTPKAQRLAQQRLTRLGRDREQPARPANTQR